MTHDLCTAYAASMASFDPFPDRADALLTAARGRWVVLKVTSAYCARTDALLPMPSTRMARMRDGRPASFPASYMAEAWARRNLPDADDDSFMRFEVLDPEGGRRAVTFGRNAETEMECPF